MKRHILTTALVALSLQAGAQTMYDAYTFSQTTYLGTARTLGMGGAVSAIGGDVGSMGINPAGAAVGNLSQFTLTPGLHYSAMSSNLDGNVLAKTWQTTPAFSNCGFTLNYEIADYGLKGVTFGFASNCVSNYNSTMQISGLSNGSSAFGELASAAAGFPPEALGAADAYNNMGGLWDVVMAYQNGFIGNYGTQGNRYVGVTEALEDGTNLGVPSDLSQQLVLERGGSRHDILMNFSFNHNDTFFWGVNIGMPVGSYYSREKITETAIAPDPYFPITMTYADGTERNTFFERGALQYSYQSEMSGIYAKIGALAVLGNLRAGAAYQTRTIYTITENWQYSGAVKFKDSSLSDSGRSDLGEYTYTFYSPRSLSVGLAYTFGYYGLLSVDYEWSDYSSMKYAEWSENVDLFSLESMYERTNNCMKAFSGSRHELRVGGELNVTPFLTLRGGFTFSTCPEKYYVDDLGSKILYDDYCADYEYYYHGLNELPSEYHYFKDNTTSVSLGLGYRSKGAFFADAAVRLTSWPTTIYRPYGDYCTFGYSEGKYIEDNWYKAPTVENSLRTLYAALTIGWRF